nr:crosslink repair DNA glycosylase YcaQ family protein [Nonomuraea diastatica]
MILNRRVLNRTTLDRQLLLRRAALSPAEAIERLVAVQGQEIDAPYVGLWTRLAAFTQDDLASLLHGRQVVRGSLLRGTQHLALAGDYVWIRPLIHTILTRARQASFGRVTQGVDLDELAKLTREHLAGRTLTRPQLRDLLLRRWPEAGPMALGFSAQAMVPVVHTPPNGIGGQRGATPCTLAEEWLGRRARAVPALVRQPHRRLRRPPPHDDRRAAESRVRGRRHPPRLPRRGNRRRHVGPQERRTDDRALPTRCPTT